MKHHLWISVAAIATAAGAVVAFPPISFAQASSAQPPEISPGIVISVGGSATISTKGMSPGSEIWAVWYSLPPGKAVAESASTAKWAWFEMSLSGSAVVTGAPTPMCHPLSAGGNPAAASERLTDAGDVEVCNYAMLPESRTENRGYQPYVFAGLAVGGPWKEDAEDDTELYLKVSGLAKSAQVTSSRFREVEKEILNAGAMTLAIRNVTIRPGARLVTTDRYPTLRLVENGQLTLSSIPKNSPAAAPKVLAEFEMTEWAPANAEEQVVLSNSGNQPVQFVEWTVAPAQAVKP